MSRERFALSTLAVILTIVLLHVIDAQERFTAVDTQAAINRVEPAYRATVRAVVGCETGHTFDPYSRGDYGQSWGAAQVHTRWQLGHFLAAGYTDRDDPYQAVEYLYRALRGDFVADAVGPWRWSCYRVLFGTGG